MNNKQIDQWIDFLPRSATMPTNKTSFSFKILQFWIHYSTEPWQSVLILGGKWIGSLTKAHQKERWQAGINLEIPKSKKQKWDFRSILLLCRQSIPLWSGKRVNKADFEYKLCEQNQTANQAWQVSKPYILIHFPQVSSWGHCCWAQSERWANVRGSSGLEPAWVVVKGETVRSSQSSSAASYFSLFYTGNICGSILFHGQVTKHFKF